MAPTQASASRRALISGAGFAGLTAALWMHELGYEVTVVETGPALKKGGTPVDLREDAIAAVDRMGILNAIRDKSLPPRPTEFVNINGGTDALLEPDPVRADGSVDSYEIHRDDLLAIVFDAIKNDVDMRFNTSIAALTDVPNGIRATFRDGSEADFALVLGCDGNHSSVRRMRFGPETDYSHFLHNYFSVTIVDETLIAPGTTRVISVPGQTVMLNSYESTTDIVISFQADEEIAYDYHDVDEHKRILRERVAAPQFTDLIEKVENADNFYFDKLSQTRMPSWTSGRVALVGDSGYCASPAAGMGGSLAMIGATALFDAFTTADGDIDVAFAEYERMLRPVVDEVQARAVDFGLATFFPASEEAIQARNALFARR